MQYHLMKYLTRYFILLKFLLFFFFLNTNVFNVRNNLFPNDINFTSES